MLDRNRKYPSFGEACQLIGVGLAFLLLACSSLASAADFVGSEQCESCHAAEYEAWQKSHHFQSMRPATEETVLGDFSGTTFEYGGITSRFYKKDGKFFVETDNEKGEMQEFEVAYTFGFYPLQQYLLPFPRGRYQALNVVWDSRPKETGGQRWVHLYPGEPIQFDDGLHWTGAFQNWNSRCATCHSTGLEKNYSQSTDRYQTTWKEINLACEACHGPASNHLAWTGGEGEASGDHSGFEFSLADRGPWGPGDKSAGTTARTLTRLDGKRPQQQIELCAGCHARRSELTGEHTEKPFNDTFHLALLEEDLYFPDGQINDEVYVYGSFLQSKMHQAGVVCGNCHEPHSNLVLAEDNGLCTQCHDNTYYNAPTHHHHEPESTGASCVNCHMPVKTYMVVDDRHDHSFRVPEPALTIQLGTPNTCNQCHQDKDANWALEALNNWGIGSEIQATHATTLAGARRGAPGALPGLMSLASDSSKPAIIRATAVRETVNYPSQEMISALQPFFDSDSALVRAAAVRSLDWLPVAQRYAMTQPLIEDPVKSVRMEVARQLAGLPVDQLPPQYAAEINTLNAEYVQSLRFNADLPESQMGLGNFYSATGDAISAEAAYRHAIRLSPAYVPAMLNLADLYRANGMDQQAEPLLKKAVAIAPEDPAAQHTMGLLLVRQGKLADAVPYLARAADLAPMDVRYNYVYAVALYETGQPARAIAVLEAALDRHPGNQDLVSALASYYQQTGEVEKLEALRMIYQQ
jgi:tetratricopeptide (TPR) repeat protein